MLYSLGQWKEGWDQNILIKKKDDSVKAQLAQFLKMTCKAFSISEICTLCRLMHIYSAFRIVLQIVHRQKGGSFLIKEIAFINDLY